ncbi:remorin-like isoform X1 [Rutidosis leptorrhynchoides]|uniref:remorin-like isoform X1 n=1 Tax=Rutidosis leptorrhynchoides TaxID=125765 RepID=UPI003A995837
MATEVPVEVESKVAVPETAQATVEMPVEVVPVTKPVAIAEKTPVPEMKKERSSLDRDIALADVEKEKNLSFIKAWEETEKSKAENKTQKELSAITAWENTKKADIEAKLKQIEENFDKKKAEYGEKIKNKVGLVHKQAEEKRAMVEAKKGEDKLKAEELAAKYRLTGTLPKKLIGCFGA